MRTILKVITLTLLFTALPGCNFSGSNGKSKNQVDKIIPAYNVKTLTYKTIGSKALQLDLYIPKQSKAEHTPLLIWVHGGAWFRGSKDEFISKNGTLADKLVNEGYAIAAVNYRLSGEAVFPAQVADINDAINYLVNHASQYNISTDKVGIMGRSAGGHLASLIATSNNDTETGFYEANRQPEYDIAVVLDFFGPSDINAMRGNSGNVDHDAPDAAEARLLGASPVERPDLAKWASSTTYIDTDTPPFIIMHGDADGVVPDSQSRILKTRLGESGVSNKLVVVQGAGHGDPVFDTEEYVDMAAEFIKSYLPVTQ